jgi:hypothetical protein
MSAMARKATRKKPRKKKSAKRKVDSVCKKGSVEIVRGRLVAGPGRPAGKPRLLKVVAEKLPWECFSEVRKNVEELFSPAEGIYLAHDVQGVARYCGRGDIFARLCTHRKKHGLKLLYFSFYIVEEKNHERELETAIIRAAGPLLLLNDRKVALGTDTGDLTDYEPGTEYIERQLRRGKRRGA